MAGLSIQALNLEPEVEAHARTLLAAQPGVVFTSGRRTVGAQCLAMAANIIESGNREFIAHVYADSLAVRQLQNWVNTHPQATTKAEIAQGLLVIMSHFPESELGHLSKHLIGRAFDVAPESCPRSAIEALRPVQFLTHEGGLARWHVSF